MYLWSDICDLLHKSIRNFTSIWRFHIPKMSNLKILFSKRQTFVKLFLKFCIIGVIDTSFFWTGMQSYETLRLSSRSPITLDLCLVLSGIETLSVQQKGTFNKHMVPDTPDDRRRSVMTAMPSISDEDIELCIEETAPKVMCPYKVLCVKSLVICTLIIICIAYELLFLYNCEILYIC